MPFFHLDLNNIDGQGGVGNNSPLSHSLTNIGSAGGSISLDENIVFMGGGTKTNPNGIYTGENNTYSCNIDGFTDAPISIILWITLFNTPTNTAKILDGTFGVGINTEKKFLLRYNKASISQTYPNQLPIGEPIMISLTFDGSVLKYYYKNISPSSINLSFSHNTYDKITFGDFDGLIHNIKIFKRILAHDEIKSFYYAGAGKTLSNRIYKESEDSQYSQGAQIGCLTNENGISLPGSPTFERESQAADFDSAAEENKPRFTHYSDKWNKYISKRWSEII